MSLLNAALPRSRHFSKTLFSFSVGFAAFGAFPTGEGVVYLSPTPTSSLLGVHREMYERLSSIGAAVHEYYVPESWVPHATIGLELPASEMGLAMTWLHANFKPLAGVYASIGLIEFRPIKDLGTFTLRSR